MGKSEDARFSSLEKSNFQLLKEKFKEKSVNNKSKSDKNGRNCESEKKKKKPFWSKWLNSVRGSWSSCNEARPPHVESQTTAAKTLEDGVDLFEIPLDSERKTSTILIKPTNSGLKAATAEHCDDPSSNKGSVPRNNSDESEDLETDETKTNQEETLKTDSKSPIEDTELLNDNNESSQKVEPLLTSALFIHKDIDKMVESAVSMEPNLSRDYAESKTSEEISQNSVRINNVHVSFKNIGNKKDEVIKTFKTTSEPTWEERQKIIHQQRLKENINCLVKQFVFLETKDVIATEKKRIQNNRSSALNSRDLSREVSPEILVNIKPFKEYVSDDTVNGRGLKKSTSSSRKSPLKHKLRATENIRIKKVSENRTCPVLRSAVQSLNKNNFVQNKENSFGVEKSILTLSPVKNNMNASWKAGVAESTSDDLDLETSSFSFWDVYKSYSTSKSLLQVEVELGETSFQFKQEKRNDKLRESIKMEEFLQSSKSLDEVLDALEDGDHDIIFQRNISQFKKKISVIPCLDFKKSKQNTRKRGLANAEDKSWRKLVQVEAPLGTEKFTVKWFAKVTDFSLKNSVKKKIEMNRSECLNLRGTLLWKPEKILENIYLMFCESAVINRVFASKIEAKTFSLFQTVREWQDMQENYRVIRIVNPTNFDETVRKLELLRAGSTEVSTFLKKSCGVDPEQSRTIALFFDFNQHDPQKHLALTGNREEKNRYTLENFQIFLTTDKKFQETSKHSLEFPKALPSCQLNAKEKLNGNFPELSKEKNTKEEDENKSKGIEIRLTAINTRTLSPSKGSESHETSCRLVLILNYPSYEYTVRIYDRKFGSFKSYSEPDMVKNLDCDKAPHSETAMVNLKCSYPTENRKMASSAVQRILVGKTRSKSDLNLNFDGFQVLYNNHGERLKDDEEETISSQNLTEEQSTHLDLENRNSNKEEEEKMQALQDEMFERSKVFEEPIRVPNYKGKSRSKEIITQEHFSVEKRRMMRSPMSLKRVESQSQEAVKRRKMRESADEEETMKTGTVTEETTVREKPDLQTDQDSPKPLKQESEPEKGRMFVVKKSGTNVKKEVMAAINLIKDMNPCKGEAKRGSKQISLVILLSKN